MSAKIKEEKLEKKLKEADEAGYLEIYQLGLRKKSYQEFIDSPVGFETKLTAELRKKREEQAKISYAELSNKLYPVFA